MTNVFGADPRDLPPLTIWEALKLAEDRDAYATVIVEEAPETRIHVFGGRLLVIDGDDQSIDLVRTIADLLEARHLCSLSPLCDVPDAADLPTLPIAESLVAAVRLKTAAAKLGHDPEAAGGTIVAATFRQTADSELPADDEMDDATDVDESDDSEEARMSEADRMRHEFFQRRSRGRDMGEAPAIAAVVTLPAPATSVDRRSPARNRRERNDSPIPAGTPDPSDRRSSANVDRSRRRSDRALAGQRGRASDADGAEQDQRPTQRTALRSLIRSLVS